MAGMHLSVLFYLLQSLIFTVNCQINGFNHSIYDLIEQLPKNYGKNISPRLFSVISKLQPKNIFNAHAEEKVWINDTACDQQLEELISSAGRFETWALQMIDSSSKIPSGLLTGNLKDLGVYDECVSINVRRHEKSIRGRHCMYSIGVKEFTTNISLTPTFSICLPSGCDADNLDGIIQRVIDHKPADAGFEIKVNPARCSTVDPEPWDAGGIVTLTILSIYLFFLISCTVCDLLSKWLYDQSEENILNKFSKFSLYTNGKRIFSTRVTSGNLPGIQGIRFFSMGWVILGHTYYMQNFGAVSNAADTIEWMKSWRALPVLTAPFTVDTFFVMSGFLLSYIFLKTMAKGRKFNPIMYYVHRYLRITPAYAAILLITIFILPRIGSGALWQVNMYRQREACSRAWWTSLLYIQNYVHNENMFCLGHTWYLAVDMQFFWLSPLILYPLAKKPWIGYMVLGGFMIASVLSPAFTSAVGEYSSSLLIDTNIKRATDAMRYYYIASHTRAGPWLMGILLGYYVATVKDRALRQKFVVLGWALAVCSFAFGFFSFRIFQAHGYSYNVYWEVFYAGFARHIWSVGVCWLIYSIIAGHGGIIGRFLSLPVFMPLGRISYCMYLVHFIIQFMESSALKLPVYFQMKNMITLFFNDFILSTVFGFLLSLFFESPFMVLEKMIFGRRRRKNEAMIRRNAQSNIDTVGISNNGYQHDNGDNNFV